MRNPLAQSPQPPSPQAAQAWLDSAQGQLLGQRESELLSAVLPHVLGYRLLQVGAANYALAAAGEGGRSAMLHHWVLDAYAAGGADVIADTQQLPFANQSVDAVLLAHSLELAPNPHALLREVDRVLCNHGQMIVLGFNPMSLWHIQHHLPSRWRGSFPLQSRFYTSGRVRDWLALLDFEVEGFSRFGTVLPWMGDMSKHGERQRWLAVFSQAYMIFARKRVVPLTPKRRSWRAITDLGHAVMPEARVQRDVANTTKS